MAMDKLHRIPQHNTMKKMILPVVAVLSLILGCESTPHYNRTKIVMVGPTLPKKSYGSVKLFENKVDVTGQYDVLALMSVEGNAGDEAAFIKAFLYRAADVGADAIILYRGSVVAGQEGGAWVVGAKGGFGLPTNPTQDEVLRGEAIHFR
jgi:hypothetical protein